jgi:hypothetical protein
MQKYAEHTLTSEYTLICSITFWYSINQVKICGYVYNVENSNMHLM